MLSEEDIRLDERVRWIRALQQLEGQATSQAAVDLGELILKMTPQEKAESMRLAAFHISMTTKVIIQTLIRALQADDPGGVHTGRYLC